MTKRIGKTIWLILGVLVCLGVSARAGVEFRKAGSWGGAYRDLVVTADRLYGLADTGRLDGYDITDPDNIILLGRCETRGTAEAMALRGDVLYIADGAAGLTVMDVSDPAAPVIVAQLDTDGFARAIQIAGDWAYLADGPNGLITLDCTTPAAPVVHARSDTPGWAGVMQILDDTLYVADGTAGIAVFSLTEPEAPRYVRHLHPENGHAVNVLAGHEDYLYVRTGYSNYIINLQDPDGPRGQFSDASYIRYTTMLATDFLLLGSKESLEVRDFQDPADPPLIAGATDGHVTALAYRPGEVWYALGDGGLRRMEVADPPLLGRYQLDDCHTSDFVLDGNLMYISTDRKLTVLDITDPLHPALISEMGVDYSVPKLAYRDGLLYAAQRDALWIMDVRNPADPQLAGFVEFPSFISFTRQPLEVIVYDHYLLAAGDDGRMQIVDITHPQRPEPLNQWSDCISDVCGNGPVVYVAIYMGNYRVIQKMDFSDPAIPQTLDFFKEYFTRHLSQSSDGRYLYGIGYDGNSTELAVIDAGLQWYWEVLGVYPESLFRNQRLGTQLRVCPDHDLLLLGDDTDPRGCNELAIMDISDPTDLQLVGQYQLSHAIQQMALRGENLWAAGEGFVSVLDITPLREYPRDRDVLAGRGKGVAMAGHAGCAYIATDQSAVHIVDWSDVAHPRPAGEYGVSGDLYSLDLSESCLFLSMEEDYYPGFRHRIDVLDVSTPAAPQLVSTLRQRSNTRDIWVSDDSFFGLYLHINGLQLVWLALDATGQLVQLGDIQEIRFDFITCLSGWDDFLCIAETIAVEDTVEVSIWQPLPSGSIQAEGRFQLKGEKELWALDIEVIKPLAIVAVHRDYEFFELCLVDVSDPDHPAGGSRYGMPKELETLWSAGDRLFAYTASPFPYEERQTIHILDKTAENALRYVGAWPVTNPVVDVNWSDGRLLVLTENGAGVQCVEIIETEDIVSGDVTDDGRLTVLDLAALRLFLAGRLVPGEPPFNAPFERADVTGDGEVDAADLESLAGRLSGTAE